MIRSGSFGLALFVVIGCASEHDGYRVAEETLHAAKYHGFDYVGTLAKAQAGDDDAVCALLAFSEHVDAASAIDHGVVLVDLAVAVTDETFAAIVRNESGERLETLERLEGLLETGFAYHTVYADDSFPDLLPETYVAMTSR